MFLLKMEDKKRSSGKPKDVFKEFNLKIIKKYERDIMKTIEYNREYAKTKIEELPIKYSIAAYIQYVKPGDFDDILQRWISTK